MRDDFDPVAYINARFPDEASLGGLDDEILADTREQWALNKHARAELEGAGSRRGPAEGGARYPREGVGERGDGGGDVPRYNNARRGEAEHNDRHKLPTKALRSLRLPRRAAPSARRGRFLHGHTNPTLGQRPRRLLPPVRERRARRRSSGGETNGASNTQA